MPPALTATKGFSFLSLISWMASATSSLPVPDSPYTMTPASLATAFKINSYACPPLRERKEDIPLLVEHFLKSTAPLQKGKPITPGFLEALQAYDWPGNVRELQNTLHRYVSLGEADFLGERINSKISETSNFGDTINHGKIALEQAMANYEKATIINALNNSQGHKVKTAATLGISRTTLFNKMKKYGIRIIIGT